jgi:hypothetical protein
MRSLVWVSLVVMWVLICRVRIWRGPGLGAMRAALVGMRRRAGFIPVRRRAGTPWCPGTIPAPTLLSSTDPRMGRKKRFR